MPLTLEEWDSRFKEQARWTKSLRAHLFSRAGAESSSRIVEIGCGTGAVLDQVIQAGFPRLIGLDTDPARLAFARKAGISAPLLCGSVDALPFTAGSIDLVYSHFLFLWLKNPNRAADQIHRVLRPGGALLSLAEPDHDTRIGYPPELAELGRAQRDALARQGADTGMGRQLADLLAGHGFRIAETGILGAQWAFPHPRETLDAEWRILRADLEGDLPAPILDRYEAIDRASAETGSRVWFVPTYYCLAFCD